MGFLEGLIVRLFLGLLGYVQAREDLKRYALAEARAAADRRALELLEEIHEALARDRAEREPLSLDELRERVARRAAAADHDRPDAGSGPGPGVRG